VAIAGRKRHLSGLVLGVIAAIIVVGTLVKSLRAPGKPAASSDSALFFCTRVLDGDTIIVKPYGSVRLIGIDAPEMNYEIGLPEPYAQEAKEFARRLVLDKWVRLEYDRERRDSYGRLLAYVYAGERFVNAEIVKAGLARAYIIRPNTKYARLFIQLEREARRRGLGIWSR